MSSNRKPQGQRVETGRCEGSVTGGASSSAGRVCGSTSRREALKLLGTGTLAASVPIFTSTPTDAADDDSWTVVALPDTQNYADPATSSQDNLSYARAQTQWIVDQVTSSDGEDIRFVSHLGDVVENGREETEWGRMDEVMSTLESENSADISIPYSVVTGNHDYAELWDRSSSTELYETYFGPERFEGRSWFGGRGPGANGLSTYQLFSAGGYQFLHLALEWEPPGRIADSSSTLGWAQEILSQHPERPTILTTHSYLQDEAKERADFVQEANGNGTPGDVVWRELIAPNPQVFMVLCGHFHQTFSAEGSAGEYHQTSMNIDGLPVYEFVSNYQDYPNDGNGWLRLMRFEPGGGRDESDRVSIETYSPALDENRTGASSEFSFDLDFETRFGEFGSPDVVSFQEGVGGYTGTVDTSLREAEPATPNGDSTSITIDANEPQGSGQSVQGLVRFDEIIGSEAGQVPADAEIRDATLTFETTDPGDGVSVHRMLVPWDDDDTWESVSGGVTTDGAQATSEAETVRDPFSVGPTTLNLTVSLREWLTDSPEYGWALLPTGGDGWDFQTAEGNESPALTVRYTTDDDAGGSGDVDGDGDIDTDDVTAVQQHLAGQNSSIDMDAADVDGDGQIDISDVVAINNMGEDR